ncbi:hypothetical protein G7K_1013-t1 [Saitoella complicata NRRL Y-17804]|uniref:Uncharacterized protein n=1 Tax=Saitoella complicata (strain BCRC 22490 / CBS 7301 / JCM 7358 / NBRC 10748 / NRRL Y-17804) TaxID=698492 RepID=A0A0E9NAD5_SAICN|nr:hypothetical protein G7K_1013-t1 [Saitoella complicata NRRL Y-17804]
MDIGPTDSVSVTLLAQNQNAFEPKTKDLLSKQFDDPTDHVNAGFCTLYPDMSNFSLVQFNVISVQLTRQAKWRHPWGSGGNRQQPEESKDADSPDEGAVLLGEDGIDSRLDEARLSTTRDSDVS